MRELAVIVSVLLAGCGDGAADAPKQAAAPAAQAISAGQWETVTEVTDFASADDGSPAIDTPKGTRISNSVCVAAGEEKKPPAMLLAGAPEYSCKYGNHYMSGGTLNSELDCTREGVRGQVLMGVDGSYTADTFEANQSLTTYLPGTGDVRINAKVTGRRTGECSAAPASQAG